MMQFLLYQIYSLSCAVAVAAAVWPQPLSLTTGQDVAWVDRGLVATVQCDGNTLFSTSTMDPLVFQKFANTAVQLASNAMRRRQWGPWGGHQNQSSGLSEYSILQEAVHNGLKSITQTKFVPWKFYTRGANFEPTANQNAQSLTNIQILQSVCPSQENLDPKAYFGSDESYTISLTQSSAQINSNSTLGTLRALQTFKQLFYAHSRARRSYAPNVPISISDAPHWSHRALSLDIARNVYGPQDVLRTLDAMESAKFSRLHLHATDSQSWPIEIPALPDLAEKGAYQPSLIWSVADLENVQSYGAKKGISVYIETDMPGHTASVHFAYPDLIAGFNESDWSTFAAEPESGQLKLNSSAVTNFINTLMSDLMPRLNQYATIYHMGGDELNANVYLLDETVRSNNSQVIQPLLQAFMSNVLRNVQNNGLRPMVWEEMVLDWNLTLPHSSTNKSDSTLVQVWRDAAHISSALKKGYSVIFGDYSHWYLDCGYGGFINPYPSGYSPPGIPYNTSGGVPTQIKDPFLDYCNPLKNWKHVYVYNPYVNITSDLFHLIEGGEVLLWSELTDPVNLDGKLWPRAASAAEVLWSGPRNESMIEDASRRLSEWRERAVLDLGVMSAPVQMTWCLMEGGCDL